MIDALREMGIPFSNPYRRRRKDWNPLHRDETCTTAAARVEAFLGNWRISFDGLTWTGTDLCHWLPMTRGVFRPRLKTKGLATLRDHPGEVPRELLEQFLPGETIDAALSGGLEWLRTVLAPEWSKGGTYACQVAETMGSDALSGLKENEPKVMVGTIHSLKGGESDVVILCPDLSYQGYTQYLGSAAGRYDATRLFYVGMTRARETLILANPAGRMAVGW